MDGWMDDGLVLGELIDLCLGELVGSPPPPRRRKH